MNFSRFAARAVLLLPLALSTPASATCSRPIVVPVAPIGVSVIVHGDEVGGIFPQLLASISATTGCKFTISPVPRARIEAMFESGKADMLVAATESQRRDRFGLFVPMLSTRPTLISLDTKRAPVRTVEELLARRELRVAVVRGFDYGPAYLALSEKLAAQGRLYLEPDPLSVARLLNGGMADATIMPPSAIYGAIQGDARVEKMANRLRIEALEELPWRRSGVYIARKSLTRADRDALEQALLAERKAGTLWRAYQRIYPAAIVAESTRPL